MATKVYYRRPEYTTAVQGRKDVGRNGDGEYATEASISQAFALPEIGHGRGDTIDEARRMAYRNLMRDLDDYMNCRD